MRLALWFIIFAVGTALLTIVGYKMKAEWDRQQKKSPPLSGDLERFRVDPNIQFVIRFGQFRILTTYQNIVDGINLRDVFNFGYDYPMKIKIEDNHLLISASFNDRDGRLIAQVVDNKWVVNPNNYFDLNFSLNTLEVVNKGKIPVLQIDIKDGNEIFIGGVFYFPTKRLFMFNMDSVITGDPKFKDDDALKKIKRIFKYPSRDYLGVKEPITTLNKPDAVRVET